MTPSVIVTERSAVGGVTGVIVSVSVAVLLASVKSGTLLGGVIVTVVEIVPVADGLTVAVRVYVSRPPLGKVAMVPAIDPLPFAAGHTAPLLPTHDHVAPPSVPGIGTLRAAPGAANGPAFSARMV